MQQIPLKNVQIGDRQRKEFAPKALDELKTSIISKGLLHPIVLREREDGFHLVAGERRTRAITALYEEGFTFQHNGITVNEGHIPYVLIGDLTPAQIAEAELEENIIRSALTWQEQQAARVMIYNLQEIKQTKEQLPVHNGSGSSATAPPKKLALKEVAEEISKHTGNQPDTERRKLAAALLIDKHKSNARVMNAKTENEAMRIIVDEQIAKHTARLSLMTGQESNHKVIHGDAFEEIKKLPKNHFSAIVCDPPYGMNADKFGKDEKHYYQDDPDYARKFCETILKEGFSLCKPKAILFMFCDVDHFTHLREYAQRQAWTVWRTPIVWQKGTDGHAPWGRAGFIRTTEFLLFAVKGAQELRYPGGPDVLNYARPRRGDRVHAAEKPRGLLQYLIKLATLPGDVVLDPCAGSGSIIPAAQSLGVSTICIEKDETYYSQAVIRSANADSIEPDEDETLDEEEELDMLLDNK